MKSHVNIFKYKDYKKYLAAVEDDLSTRHRGFRSRLSEALGVQNAYVSKVLNQTKFQFTLEQTMKLANFLELKEDENTYLVWLVEWSRAGTKELKQFCASHIERAQIQQLNIKERMGDTKVISEAHQNKFYSHWLYTGAYVLSSIPQLRSLEKMSEALRVEPKLLSDILFFLVECGLLNAKGDGFTPGTSHLHLEKKSSNMSKHHMNWRLKAIDDAADPYSTGIHYSTASSLSNQDWEKLSHDLTDVIQNYVDVIRDSPEETACCFNLDFFKIIKD